MRTRTEPPRTEQDTPAATEVPDEAGRAPRRIAFRVISVLAVVLGGALFIFGLMEIPLMWLPDETVLSLIDDPELDLAHRSHYYAMGVMAWLVFPALAVQLRKPWKRTAAMLQGVTLMAVGTLIYLVAGGFVATDAILLALFATVAVLHPRARDLLTRPSFDRPMLTLAALAAVPWLAFAARQARLQLTLTDIHAAEHHWSLVAVMSVSIVLVAAIGATRHVGWRFSATSAALASIAVGAHALAWPGHASTLGGVTAVAAIVWGLAYAAAAVQRSRREPVVTSPA